MGIQSPSVSNLMQNSNLRGQYLKVYRKIICERLHIKNLIVIHAIQKKIFKTYYYFSTKEGYEYQKDGIRFYIRKDDDEWNISVELGFRVHRCNSYKEVIDFFESLDIQNILLPAMEKGKEFIESHRNEIVDEEVVLRFKEEIEEIKAYAKI